METLFLFIRVFSGQPISPNEEGRFPQLLCRHTVQGSHFLLVFMPWPFLPLLHSLMCQHSKLSDFP